MNLHAATILNNEAIDLSGTFIRRTNLTGVNLENADLSGADCSHAIFHGANLTDANLNGTILKGADLTNVVGLTREQLSLAVIDKTTILPSYLALVIG
jgi:uncharacterized protein YjbI with pentapeptide repeats